MKRTDGPVVTECAEKNGYTSITWNLDLKQFGITSISEDTSRLMYRYALDAAMITGITVKLNGAKLPNKLTEYFDLMKLPASQAASPAASVFFESNTCRTWLIASDDETFEHISFVNGIRTKVGGKHVDAVMQAVCKPLVLKLKNQITVKELKKWFKVLIVCKVPNPQFESQEKTCLESPTIKIDPISKTLISRITKWSMWQDVKSRIIDKEKRTITQTVKKTVCVDGYDRANNSGGGKSEQCILIVCEGLSAKTFAVAGISKGIYGKRGRDWFGIYPLRGKLLNTRNASINSVKSNAVITNMIKILGLNICNPNDLSKLNYGKICMITDADVDGIHIEGLILNFFHTLFPNLLTRPGFVVSMKTPILKVSSSLSTSRYYFDDRSYDTTKLASEQTKIKYYKGLGTAKSEDVKDIFGIKLLEFRADADTDKYFDISFNKTKSDDRRKWLASYVHSDVTHSLDNDSEPITNYSLSTYLNKELIKFFRNDCDRNIPNVYDGLKESQRKVVYAIKKRNLNEDVKVAQFGAYVAEQTQYHHGEENLFNTIIKMAQSFPGTNNIPLLSPEGQFGTRLSGGEDAASPRYIYTKKSKYFDLLFPSVDDDIYSYKIEDGSSIEPDYYVPILPMLLINGCLGIGSGWLSNVPSFSYDSVLENAKTWMLNRCNATNRRPLNRMIPYFNGFDGIVTAVAADKFETKGLYVKNKDIVIVSELPIGLWNDKFKIYCEENKAISDVIDKSSEDKINFQLKVTKEFDVNEFDRKLTTHFNTNNIVVFDNERVIRKISVEDVFDLWGVERIRFNEMRKRHRLKILNHERDLTAAKIAFIRLVYEKKLLLTDSERVVRKSLDKHDLLKYETVLLNLSVRFLTNDNKTRLEKKLREIAESIDELSKKTTVDIWLDDIAKL